MKPGDRAGKAMRHRLGLPPRGYRMETPPRRLCPVRGLARGERLERHQEREDTGAQRGIDSN